MKMTDKIDLLMKERQLNKRQLSMQARIPYTTISSFYDKGTENVKLSTLKSLARFFDVSLDYIADDSVEDRNYGKSFDFKVGMKEIDHIKKYRTLDEYGQGTVDLILDRECTRCAIAAQEEGETIDLMKFLSPVSAGSGVPLDGSGEYDYIKVASNSYTRKADFCLTVRGDSMEPKFYNGDIILVEEKEDIDYGEIGIFIVDGYGYVKKKGDRYLISLNEKVPNIYIDPFMPYRCDGLVIGVLDPDWMK